MLRVWHHSGAEKLLDEENIEVIYPDAAGFAIVRMVSGAEYTIDMTYEAVCQFWHEQILDLHGPKPLHPDRAQKGPLPPPTGEQSPILPRRGIQYGTARYDEAK